MQIAQIENRIAQNNLHGLSSHPTSKAWKNNQVFKNFQNIITMGAIQIPLRILFLRKSTLTEKDHFLDPNKWHSLDNPSCTSVSTWEVQPHTKLNMESS